MIGFFENQYLSYKKNHIKNLLALAKADGFIHEKEEKMLFKIGKRYGLKKIARSKELVDSKGKISDQCSDNHHDKMNVLYDLMLMVYADNVVKNEIAFCEDVVKKFGMKKEVVKWLIEKVFEKGTPPQPDEWADLKEEALTSTIIKVTTESSEHGAFLFVIVSHL